MTRYIEQGNNLDTSTVRLTSLVSDRPANLGKVRTAAQVGLAPVRAGANVTRVAVVPTPSLPASVTATPQAS